MKNIYHIYYLVTLLAVLLCQEGRTQTWQPIRNGVASEVMAYCVDGNNMYIGCADTTFPFKKLRISVWNGFFWTDLPSLTTTSTGHRIYKIFVFKNEIYVLGDFDSIVNLQSSRFIVRYDGKKWKDVGGGIDDITFSYLSVQEYNNKLYLSNMYKAGSIAVMHIGCWDGSSWSKLGTPVDGTNDNITQLSVYGNKLCAAGNFTLAGGINASHIAFWDGNSWSVLGDTTNQGVNGNVDNIFNVSNNIIVYGTFNMAGKHTANGAAYWDGIDWNPMNQTLKSPIYYNYLNNAILCIGKDSASNLYRFETWNGTTWINHSEIFDYFYPQSYLTFNNEKWIIGKFKFQNDPAYYDIVIYNGATISLKPFIGNVPGSYNYQRYLIQYKNNLIITGSFTQFKHVKFNHIACLYNGAYGRIEGTVYYDKNRDCVRDSGDYGLESRLIKVSPGNYFLSTDEQGRFGGYIDTGFKTISLVPQFCLYKYWQLSPCNPLGYNLYVKDTVMYLNNIFGTYPVPDVKDIKVTFTGQSGRHARKGYNETYYLNYENIGTTAISNGTVTLNIDPKVKLLTAVPGFNFNSGQMFSWDFTNLQPAENHTIRIIINVDSTLNIGDSIIYDCYILPVVGDLNGADNYDLLTQKIVTSVDPNDKLCFPDGNILATTDVINYTIRFQNTGNDTALRVIVIDTVETENLPLEEIEMKTTSHPYKLDVINNVLIWTFNHILLPDSTRNEPKSHGYIRYAAHIKPGLAVGTKIQNQAYIFFDYMRYVPSNKTLNTIVDNTGIVDIKNQPENEIVIYPNPSSDKIFILFTGQNNHSHDFIIYDNFGRKIKSFKLQKDEIKILEISDLNDGLYFIKSNDGKYAHKIIVRK